MQVFWFYLFNLYFLTFCIGFGFLFEHYLEYSIIIIRFSSFNICFRWYFNSLVIFSLGIRTGYFHRPIVSIHFDIFFRNTRESVRKW